MLANSQPRFFATIGDLDWYSGSHRQWIDELGLSVDDRVLEIGCATGALTSYLADSGFHATGLDRSSAMIDHARKGHPHLDLRVGDATSLPYDEDAFDAVVAASVVNVVDDAKQVVSEMRRVCAPGGTVSVLVPSVDFTDEDLDALTETLDSRGSPGPHSRSGTGAPPSRAGPNSTLSCEVSTSNRLLYAAISAGCSSRQAQSSHEAEPEMIGCIPGPMFARISDSDTRGRHERVTDEPKTSDAYRVAMRRCVRSRGATGLVLSPLAPPVSR
jgi:SAM-dependent methyltransferase